MQHLMEYGRPGNVRELKQAKKRLREEAVAHGEGMSLLKALERNEWNVAHAPEDTGMDRRDFQKLMRRRHLRVQAPQDHPEESNGKPED